MVQIQKSKQHTWDIQLFHLIWKGTVVTHSWARWRSSEVVELFWLLWQVNISIQLKKLTIPLHSCKGSAKCRKKALRRHSLLDCNKRYLYLQLIVNNYCLHMNSSRNWVPFNLGNWFLINKTIKLIYLLYHCHLLVK